MSPEGKKRRAAWNTWRGVVEGLAATKQAMIKVAQSFRLRGSRQAWNAWAAMVSEVRAARARAEGLLRTFRPEGRQTRAAWNSWAALRQMRVLIRKAASLATTP